MCEMPGKSRLVQGGFFPVVDGFRWSSCLEGFCHLTKSIFFVGLCAILLEYSVRGLPLSEHGTLRKNSPASAVSKAVDFLTKFGYLPPTEHGTGNLRTERQLQSAIRSMQRFGNLEPTGFVDEVTLQLMKRPRCGVPDVLSGEMQRTKRYAVQGQKWSSTNLTWSVRSSDSEARSKMVRSQLQRAFNVWSEASVLNFSEVWSSSFKGPADIVVSFLKGPHGDGYPFDGEGSVLAHAFFPGEGIGGDAHFDAEEHWMSEQAEKEEDGVNFFAVAAHEIGHSLGLSHSSSPGALMFPYYQSMREDFKLPHDDTDGINYLYGKQERTIEPSVYAAPTVTSSSTTTEKSFSTTRTSTTSTKLFDTSQKEITETTTKIPVKSFTDFPEIPDICNTSIDAASVIRGEVFLFKKKYFWRLDANRTLRIGYPVPIERFWYNLPLDLERIDALYERTTDTKIVFFSGEKYWLFSANQLEPGYPRPLTDLGLPANLDHIDAAMVWGYNGRTYFFSDNEYWKFDENEGKVELDYPRDISAWRGIPIQIDAAFTWNDGNTYFFKDTKFWKFQNVKMNIENKSPLNIGDFWFKCGILPEDRFKLNTTQNTNIIGQGLDASSSNIFISWLCIVTTIIHIIVLQSNYLM